MTLQAFLDEDNNASTGCAITTTVGTFSGAELVLTTTVDTTAGQVTAVSLPELYGEACLELQFPSRRRMRRRGRSESERGSRDRTLIESYIPVSALGAFGLIPRRFHLDRSNRRARRNSARAHSGRAGRTCPTAAGIPTLSEWGFLALGLLLSLAGLLMLRRGGAGGSLLVVLIVFALAAGVAWAAITLTGNPTDWAGVPPVATQPPDANPTHADIYAVYATSDGTSLFFRFDVKLCPVITVGPTTLPDGTINAAYPATTFSQTGAAVPILWSETGAPPPGMTFSSEGLLSGTPTQTGTFPITFTVTDANGCKGNQAITLTVNACPVITVNQSGDDDRHGQRGFQRDFYGFGRQRDDHLERDRDVSGRNDAR